MSLAFRAVMAMLSCLANLPHVIKILLVLANLPTTAAFQDPNVFPDVPFKVFSDFVENTFGPTVSLSTVLLLVFSVLENPELFSLHARQQCPKYEGERRSTASSWMKHLACALQDRLADNSQQLFQKHDLGKESTSDQALTVISIKLVALAHILQFYPLDGKGKFLGKLQPVSQKAIQPTLVICPGSVECETMSCNPRSLLQATKTRDIPRVTLIKNLVMYENVPVLTGKCPVCQTLYYADHERTPNLTEENQWNRVYLNSAKYFKVGQALWVDQSFSNAIMNVMNSFHASAAAYMEFWNNSFWKPQDVMCRKISRRQVWQAFVQESVRAIATQSQLNLELRDGLSIDEVTKEAFELLGENGIIWAADKHACSECTQVYKRTADIITGDDPAAMAGNDENRVVPPLVGEDAELAINDAACAKENARNQAATIADQDMDVDHAPVKMVVLDGIVMGPVVCILAFCVIKITHLFTFVSIVHMMIVLQMWQMLVEESSVHFMIMNMGLNAVFGNATIKKFLELKLARSIGNSGLDILHSIAVKLKQVCEEF